LGGASKSAKAKSRMSRAKNKQAYREYTRTYMAERRRGEGTLDGTMRQV
jgi:hypothetical protein